MDRRQVFGWVGILICLGVPIAWALTGSFSDTVWQVPTLKADNIFVGAVNVTKAITTSESSYTVWVNAGTYYAKNGATGAVTSNANSATLINACITAMSTLGGTIHLKQGVYTITASITLLDGVWLQGDGWNIGSNYGAMPNVGTVIKVSGNIPGIYANNRNAVKISDLVIDGENYGLPIVAGNHNIDLVGCSDPIVSRVSSLNSKDAGIYLNTCIEARVESCETKTNSGSGIEFDSSYDSHITAGLSGSNQVNGIYIKDSSEIEVSGLNSFTNTERGIVLQNSYGVRLLNDRCDENIMDGVLIYKSVNSAYYGNYNAIQGCAFISNSHASPGTYSGITIQGDSLSDVAAYNTVVACQLFDVSGSFQGVGINLGTYTSDNIVTDNIIVGMINYPIYNTGINNLLHNNEGATNDNFLLEGVSIQELIQSTLLGMGYNANATPPTPPTPPTTPGLPHYTVKYSAPNYITTSDAGANLYTGISATTAIQTGLNSVTAGKMLDIQGGITYPITSQLTLTKNGVYIHANASAILQFSAAVTGYCFLYSGTSSTHYSDSIINGLTFDCNHNSYGLRVKWCDNVTMTDCTIQNTVHSSYSDGVDWGGDAASPCSVATVTNCTLNGIYYSGLSFSYITDIVVQNSTLNGFCQVYPSGGGIHTDDGCSNVLITSNSLTSTGCLNDGIYVGTTRSFITGCTVTNNTIDLTGPGSAAGYGGAGIKAYAIGATITDNTIDWDDVANEYGVSLWGQANTVTGNTISNCPWGITSWSGYYSSAQHIIQYNDISSCTIGIKLENNDSTANHSTFAGNGTDMVNTGTGNTVTPNP